MLNKVLNSLPEMANESYRIEYQPQLVEDTVLWVIAGRLEEKSFRKERNPIYQLQNEEAREENFQVLHERWYDHLGLSEPLHKVLAIWPILKLQTHKCQVVKARSKKDVGAELYIAADTPGVTDREGRSIVIQVTPELLGQPQNLLTFLRHEFLHIVDMLDPQFGYKPHLPKSENGPTYDRFLQKRYGILWDISIDGRLHRRGWLPASVKGVHWTTFKNNFPGPQSDLEKVFGFFFNNISPKHEELLSFCRSPETWFNTSNSESTIKGQCTLCQFPSFDLIDASTNLPSSLVAEIQNENPTCQSNEPICHQCADLYELRVW